MSEGEHQPTNRPAPDGAIQPLGYLLGLQFHPPIKLAHQKGIEFVGKLSSVVDAPQSLELHETHWSFSQPLGSSPGGFLRVMVQESQLTLEAGFPSFSLEWFEHRYEFVVEEFRKLFTPQLLLTSSAAMRGTLPVDGDARLFLTTYVTKVEPKRLSPLRRPMHLFGIRIMMPPYEKPGITKGKGKKAKPEKVEWLADVKAESLVEDTHRLYLEVSGQWPVPRQWDEKTTKCVVGQLAVVSEFMKLQLLPFLTAESTQGD